MIKSPDFDVPHKGDIHKWPAEGGYTVYEYHDIRRCCIETMSRYGVICRHCREGLILHVFGKCVFSPSELDVCSTTTVYNVHLLHMMEAYLNQLDPR